MSIAVSDDGQFVAAGSVDGTVRVWNLATSDQIFSKIISGSLILDVDFSPNIAMLFISASGKEVSAIELVSGKQVWVSEAIGPDVFAMEINSKNGTLVTATSQGYIQILDIENGDVMATAKSNDGSLRDIAVMPDGNRLMLTTRVGALHVWNLANLGKILSLPVANELDEMAISPDGTRIAICSASPIVHILDSVSRGERIKEQRK
jgi:WD40 repeat protein